MRLLGQDLWRLLGPQAAEKKAAEKNFETSGSRGEGNSHAGPELHIVTHTPAQMPGQVQTLGQDHRASVRVGVRVARQSRSCQSLTVMTRMTLSDDIDSDSDDTLMISRSEWSQSA